MKYMIRFFFANYLGKKSFFNKKEMKKAFSFVSNCLGSVAAAAILFATAVAVSAAAFSSPVDLLFPMLVFF